MNTFLNILKLFPYILASVASVEQIAAGAPGATKKQIILNSITAVAQIGEQIPFPQVAMASAIIDSVVADLNASGIFTHAPKPAPPAAALQSALSNQLGSQSAVGLPGAIAVA